MGGLGDYHLAFGDHESALGPHLDIRPLDGGNGSFLSGYFNPLASLEAGAGTRPPGVGTSSYGYMGKPGPPPITRPYPSSGPLARGRGDYSTGHLDPRFVVGGPPAGGLGDFPRVRMDPRPVPLPIGDLPPMGRPPLGGHPSFPGPADPPMAAHPPPYRGYGGDGLGSPRTDTSGRGYDPYGTYVAPK